VERPAPTLPAFVATGHRLNELVTLKNGFDPDTPLKDALDSLREQSQVANHPMTSSSWASFKSLFQLRFGQGA
jgi:hypothetical protein